MNVERSLAGDVQVFRVTGRLDSTTSAAFEAQALSAVRPGANRVVLDLTAVDYVSSSGLRVVLLAAKQTRATQGRFAIFGMSPAVHNVFRMSGFARVLDIFDHQAEAIVAARGK